MNVLDTNIILENPYVIEQEGIGVPVHVIFELNKFKSDGGKRGHNARQALRILLRHNVFSVDGGSNINGIGEPINIIYEQLNIQDEIIDSLGYNDLSIMMCARDNNSTLHTSDAAMAIIAKLIGIPVEYVVHIPDNYDGYEEIYVDTEIVNSAAAGAVTPIPETYYKIRYNDDMAYEVKPADMKPTTLMSNEYIKLIDINNTNHFTYARYDYKSKSFFPVKHKIKAFGIEPMSRNIGQTVFMDALMNPEIKILTVESQAGAGKSLLALAAAIEQTYAVKKPLYSKTFIFRSLEAVSEEIGFLPGDANDKVDRWHDSLYDSFELLLNKNKVAKQGITREYMQSMLLQYNVEIGVLTFIRGRSLLNSFIIIDEAQNITPDVMRTIVTRCGEGTKLVILGDPSQIDNPKCTKEYNGLTHLIRSLHKRYLPEYAHVTLDKCERSNLAEIGIKYL